MPAALNRGGRVGGVLLVLALGGCGTTSKPHVAPDVQRQLPTQVAALPSYLCPHPSQSPTAASADRRLGQRQLRALEQAYRRNPDALVRATFVLPDDGTKREQMTVAELLKSHVLGFTSRLGGADRGSERERCLRRGLRTLQALQRGRQ